jgi:hypothetical protein
MAVVDFVRVALLDKPPLVDWPAQPGALLKVFESDTIIVLVLGTLALAVAMALMERTRRM